MEKKQRQEIPLPPILKNGKLTLIVCLAILLIVLTVVSFAVSSGKRSAPAKEQPVQQQLEMMPPPEETGTVQVDYQTLRADFLQRFTRKSDEFLNKGKFEEGLKYCRQFDSPPAEFNDFGFANEYRSDLRLQETIRAKASVFEEKQKSRSEGF